jgi:hypothetical protein
MGICGIDLAMSENVCNTTTGNQRKFDDFLL